MPYFALIQKKPNPALDKSRFATFHDGLCLQVMHVGPYNDTDILE
jgi:hypothetical protein